jgi:hypothetical protein
MNRTAALREALPRVFKQYEVKTFLDAPCGDWFWMQTVDLTGIDYIGADISGSLIEENTARFARDGVRFIHLDITADSLPASDMLLCRDCLFHLQFWLRWKFFANFSRSECRHLMLTIDHVDRNDELRENGGFKRFNPMAPPFNLPEPLEMIAETTKGQPRSLGIWTRQQIAEAVQSRRQEDTLDD